MAITNTEISQKISDLVDKWQLREDEMIDWLAGTAGGGPLSDGKYPLTDILGATVMVTCPAQMEQDVESLVGGAAGSAAAASASATAAALSEANAALSEAAASASAGAASASEAAAALSKTTAANHEANALFHANAADASATAASLSETNADASATAAAASFDSFDDRYLGSKATEPTTDNDGNALLVGALFWHTGVGFKGWNGSAWVAIPGVTAGAIANTPAGGISATDVQAALNELDTEKAPKATPTLTGTVYLPDQPRCVASRNNAAFETMAGDTSFGILGALHVNTGSFYAGALVGASGSALHAPVTGYYKVDLMAYFQSLSNSGRLFVLKNNTTPICLVQHASITGDEASFSSGIIHLTAGDYINFKTGLADIIVNNIFPYTYVNITFLG